MAVTAPPGPLDRAQIATRADYLAQLQALLPPGDAWPRDPDATLTRLLDGLAAELAAVDARAGDLIEEADPRATAEMLGDWESVFGLPDPCVGAAETGTERQARLVQKVTEIGGQSVRYFQTLAQGLGYAIRIQEHFPTRFGALFGAPFNGPGWGFAWTVETAEIPVRPARFGLARAGDPFRSWGDALLECVLTALKPAHTALRFAYGAYAPDETAQPIGQAWDGGVLWDGGVAWA